MTQLDILFITPPSRLEVYQKLSGTLAAIEPPVWSGLLAYYMRDKGYSVQMLDAEAEGLTHEEVVQRIIAADPILSVFVIYGQQPSASTQCMPGAIKTAQLLKSVSTKNVASIAIGTHPSALPKMTLEEGVFTFVCKGEGPLTIHGLIEHLKGEGRSLSDIPGLWYYDDNGLINNNLDAPLLNDLDEQLPYQALDLLDMTKYRAHNWHCFDNIHERQPYASLQTSLGCPYKCSFCCINAPFGTNVMRKWSAENVIKQIDELVVKYGVKNIKIPDEMFVLNKRHVEGICDQIIDRGYDLNIWAYARVDTVGDIQMLNKLKAAGFNWLGIGIESASKYVRDGAHKGRFDNIKINDEIQKVRDAGIYVGANYIFGLPDDTLETMQETLDLAVELNTEWANFYCAMAYPGSALFTETIEKGWALPHYKGGPGWIGYAQHGYDALPLRTAHLSAYEVLDFRDKAFDIYFKGEKYLSMIEQKFSTDVRVHVEQMTKYDLPRKHRSMSS